MGRALSQGCVSQAKGKKRYLQNLQFSDIMLKGAGKSNGQRDFSF